MDYEQYFTFLRHLLTTWLNEITETGEPLIDAESYENILWSVGQQIQQGVPVEQLPYYPYVLQFWSEAQGMEAAGAPMTGITGGYETQEVAGNTLAILRDDEGNVIDTINLGVVEAGGMTPAQQAELDLLNQKFQFQQQQWQTETAMSQQQMAMDWAMQQAQMQQQAAMQQAGMGFEAQMAQMPYQGMTAYQQSQMDLANRQYQAEMMANPSRWIESYYGQQMPQMPPWQGQQQIPQIQVPQIQTPQMQMPPIEYPPWWEMFPEELPPEPQQTPFQQAEAASIERKRAAGVASGWALKSPRQKAATVQKAALETIGRPLKPSPYV